MPHSKQAAGKEGEGNPKKAEGADPEDHLVETKPRKRASSSRVNPLSLLMRSVVQLDNGIAVGQLTALRQVKMSISRKMRQCTSWDHRFWGCEALTLPGGVVR